MTFRTLVATMATVAVLGSAASAQEARTNAGQATEASDAKPAKEKKICRSLMPTGTIMATRVCNTAAAWKTFDAYTADGADQFRATYRMSTTGKQPD